MPQCNNEMFKMNIGIIMSLKTICFDAIKQYATFICDVWDRGIGLGRGGGGRKETGHAVVVGCRWKWIETLSMSRQSYTDPDPQFLIL